MSTRKKTAAAVVLAATLAATVSGTAVAAGKSGTTIERNKITVCVTPKSTHLRLVPNSTKECPNGGRLMTWQASGKAGAAGQKGTDGRDGADGTDGTDGASAYDVAVTYGFDGTESDWLESLKGADGQDGADGANGLDGTNGVDGQDGAPGMDGAAGLDGAAGPAGASAYDVAVTAGFEGTEAEWLASLKGADGATGPQGLPGEPGAAGAGITADAMYERTAAMPSRADGRSTHTLTCDPGDVVLFPYHSLDGGMALVERMVPIGTDGVEFQVGGPTAATEFVGIRCLDVDGGVVVP